MPAAIDDVAAAILARTGEVTTWKLQKLSYYAQAWHLVRYGEKLFDDDFEAWEFGPVASSLYRHHRGMNRVAGWPRGDVANLNASQVNHIDWIIRQYGAFTAESLSRMSHIEAPWFVARGILGPGERSNAVIDTRIMRSFYSRQLANPDDSVITAVANASLEGVELDEDWQGRLRQVAEGEVSADDAVAAEINRLRGC